MTDSKYSENDPERTLITLDQLSQTIEVMTSVVNRLRKHLSQQIAARQDYEKTEQLNALTEQAISGDSKTKEHKPRKSYVVEISQPDSDSDCKDETTLH